LPVQERAPTTFRARTIVTLASHTQEAIAVLDVVIVATGPVAELGQRCPGVNTVEFGNHRGMR
jgi:hypothetical protein